MVQKVNKVPREYKERKTVVYLQMIWSPIYKNSLVIKFIYFSLFYLQFFHFHLLSPGDFPEILPNYLIIVSKEDEAIDLGNQRNVSDLKTENIMWKINIFD